ncbi:MAG: AbrB/MazE/SpoVT family DNA-binding domain-containing protein [Oscillospiraceae bacterium]|nr:AbrB/MazE/SpoVT family DNA-binding domain-containing protein [Oscillospiraceae bacterium]
MERTVARSMDEVGRVVLPLEFRRMLGWVEETKIAIQLDGNKMVLFAEPCLCFLCAGQEDLRAVKDRYICKACIAELNEA